jgi:hypothetical protein
LTDGYLREVTAIRDHPFLIHAAVEAVTQGAFEPVIVDGQPVEVTAPIDASLFRALDR